MQSRLKILSFFFTFIFCVAEISGCKTVPKQGPRKKNEPADKWLLNLGMPIEKGVLFRTFDRKPERLHEGLSFGAPSRTHVFAAQNGKVLFTGQANNNLGNMVIISHMEPFITVYGHLEKIDVKNGQSVKKGQRIGTVGTTGGVESPQVYFELRKDRMPVDPELYL